MVDHITSTSKKVGNMNVEQTKIVDSQAFWEHLSQKSRWNSIELCDLVIGYDGKEIKLTKEQIKFYSMTGLNNIHIIEEVLENLQ